jgi:DNA-binding XRE family transcriptional regulator
MKMTKNAIHAIQRRHFRTKESRAGLEEARAGAEIARRVFELRSEAGLTQAELAKVVGTSRTVITRLEDDDYTGHSLSMLRRVAGALHKRVEIRFVPMDSTGRVA